MAQSRPSRPTLENAPARAVAFLGAVGRNPSIYAILERHGYSQQAHSQGFELLRRALSLDSGVEEANVDNAVRRAITELDQWDEPHFRMARAALDRLHPAQSDFIFEELSAGQGFEAVLSVTTFLDRLDALASSPAREESREADRAALTTLAGRGIDEAERDRLRGLIEQASTLPALPDEERRARNQTEIEARQEALWALYSWHQDWSSTARAFIRRRDHLIALGMASRRASGTVKEPPQDL